MSRGSFVWGAATSAFQIEGARREDGKGDSIWDRFADEGRIAVGGETACDHYHRWPEDLDLLAALGVDAYRFSVAWTRVIPDGDGEVNQTGLDFYRRLVDGLVERGIQPWPTLYHWDLPQALQTRGGWARRETATAFARYVSVVAEALGFGVRSWITHNEPWVASFLGHLEGVFAPGLTDWPTALRVAHHILVSHGLAVDVIRELHPEHRVGIALDCRPVDPAGDVSASRHFDGFRNRWFFDPVFGRGYPDDMLEIYNGDGRLPDPLVMPGDMEVIARPIDFLGVNYYTTIRVTPGREERDDPESPPGVEQPPGFTEMGWRVDPEGLRRHLHHLEATYRPGSIVVTENGASYSTGPDDQGVVDDRERIRYLAAHIDAVEKARLEGVPVDGYFVWSLLDNLEWALGFSQRFGLVWVDHDTGRRIPKRSFAWYSDRMRRGILPAS